MDPLQEITAWIDDRLADAGSHRRGPVREVRRGVRALVLTLETDRGRWWVKVVPDLFSHEVAVTELRADVDPGSVPPVVAADRALGQSFWDWGIPTAASLLMVAPSQFRTVIATGGISTGLDAARALVLGAHAVGIARPVLQALERGGRAQAVAFLSGVERELRTALLLIGARDVDAARQVPRLLTGELSQWETLAR